MRPSRRLVAMLAMVALLGGVLQGVADAQPPPPPPPNPSNQDLQNSRESVNQRADQVGQLTGKLAALDAQTDALQAALEGQRETAQGALVDLQSAQDAAAAAARKAADARIQTEAAGTAIDQAQAKIDDFVTSTYQQGIDLGPLGLLTSATSPDDLVTRAEANDFIARSQIAAQDALQRARVDKANADSAARAALDDARDREGQAQKAKKTADAAVAAADVAARASVVQLQAVATQRAAVQAQLDAAVSSDAGLRAQRQRFDAWQAQQAAIKAAADRAARAAAAARVAADNQSSGNNGGGGPGRAPSGNLVQRVIDRAMSQLGVQYVWGGGSPRGPTTGIPDGLGSPLNLVGFDCSGLMQYAFAGAGISLPRVSRSQYNAGQQVPIADVQPGDMIFYGSPIHHVAMYVGNGQMIEAPYTGANVRLVPMRMGDGLRSEAVRVL